MNDLQRDWNVSKRKEKIRFWRLNNPGVIALLVILLGVGVVAFLSRNSSDSKGTAEIQHGAAKQATGQSPTFANGSSKTSQLPAFDITKRSSQPPLSSEADFIKWMSANSPEDKSYLMSKWEREQAIITNQDASDPRILQAFLRAPREFFFRASNPIRAYAKSAEPIGFGQTISGPHLVSRMTQAINPQPDQKVLEIGTGSGYQSAFLAELSNYVYTIEIVPQLAQKADAAYSALSKNYPEYANIKRKNADGYYGWAEYAPFDRIIVTAGIDHVPPDLLKQLAPGGIMVIPVGPPSGQTILKISKEVSADGSVTFKREDIYNGRTVVFVPFTAGQGSVHSNAADQPQNP